MNTWAETQITVRNKGARNGLKYEYSFILYLPENFAKLAMFQLVELDDSDTRLDPAKKASDILMLDPASLKLVRAETTAQGIAITNDYAALMANGGRLEIETSAPCAVLQSQKYSANEKSTYSTYHNIGGALRFVAPISVSRKVDDMRFYRITVNLSYTQNEYILSGGESRSFLFRLVLRDAIDAESFSTSVFSPSMLLRDDGSYALPQVDEKYECRWAAETDKDGLPVLQIKEKASGEEWISVIYGGRIGLSSPTRMAAVFTQCDA